MTLYEATKDLHHACEQHTIGIRMNSGSITPQEWADWLWAMSIIHCAFDYKLPKGMSKQIQFFTDLESLPEPNISPSALNFAWKLSEDESQLGAAYVLHGAHCSGGRVLAPKMSKRGLPTSHTVYKDREEVKQWLAEVRVKSEHTQQARDTFGCLLKVMDEIEARNES